MNYGGNGKRQRHAIGSLEWPDFNPININHELCYYTDDVT
jgi:hypothetical protein